MYSHDAFQVTVLAGQVLEHTHVHTCIPVGIPAQKHHPPDLKLYMRKRGTVLSQGEREREGGREKEREGEREGEEEGGRGREEEGERRRERERKRERGGGREGERGRERGREEEGERRRERKGRECYNCCTNKKTD